MPKSTRFSLQRNPLERKPAPVLMAVPREETVLNLDRINLDDRGNWLRAIESCRPQSLHSLPELLDQIAAYQGQIDKAIQTAEAQSTIYAYAIGVRLDLIEEKQLYKEQGYRNLTEFINAGEVRRPTGASITPRQVWAYRRVTRGLNDFLELVEQIRSGDHVPDEVLEHVQTIGQHLKQDVIQNFLTSYVDGIASVLELGVSKLEQVCRLPKPIALSGLLSGQLNLSESVVPVHDVSFSQLRKVISHHGKKSVDALTTESDPKIEKKLSQLEQMVKEIKGHSANKRVPSEGAIGKGALDPNQKQRLRAVIEALSELVQE